MKGSYAGLVVVMVLVLSVPLVSASRHLPRRPGSDHTRHRRSMQSNASNNRKIEEKFDFDGVFRRPTVFAHGAKTDTVQVAGSRLPDCSHACGSCSPCRLVMVSFVCSTLQEAETCPMAYKCMCHNKSYPVP